MKWLTTDMKEWLSQFSANFVAGVAVLVVGALAVWLWPPLKQWAVGHQTAVYLSLALIVGIAIGRLSKPLGKGPITSDGIRWERVADIYWLGGDLHWSRQMTQRGVQDKVAHGLKQAYHHCSELG